MKKNEDNEQRVRGDGAGARDPVPIPLGSLDRLDHQVHVAGGQDVGLETLGELIEGHAALAVKFDHRQRRGHGDALVHHRERRVGWMHARGIERSGGHVARNYLAGGQHVERHVRRNRGARVEDEMRQVRSDDRAIVKQRGQPARRRVGIFRRRARV